MKGIKRILSVVVALTLCAGLLSSLSVIFDAEETSAAVATSKQVNVGVDFNGTDNRSECRHATFEDWMIAETQSASYEAEGLTFTVSNESADGKGNIKTVAKKNLVNATGDSPVLTLDGLRVYGTFKGGVIKLQIDGLPEGSHTITTWHSFYDVSSSNKSKMTVNINGVDAATGVEIPNMVKTDDAATILYMDFEAKEGEPVVIYFKTDGTGMYDIPVLNAFEIDGVHPLKSIKNAYPADGETHFEPEEGLSWTAAEGAVGHRVFIGEDKYTVSIASRDFPQFKEEVTECSYDLSGMELDHMKTYYWRVDEVYSDGTVTTGKVNSFKVVHLAFPSAEGYGRYANGGRGGKVLEVTTLEDGYEDVLDDAGQPILDPVLDVNGDPVLDENGVPKTEVRTQPIEGSLRWAIESFTGPRIVVFKVGGVINLVDKLTIDGTHGDIYIAGQTAPGDGITLNNYTFGAMGASDVVIRNVRVRIGDISDQSMGGMGLGGANHSIVDHCSIAWATDEGFSSRNGLNVTFQRSIIAESLNNSVHYAANEDGSANRDPSKTERHSFAASIGGKIGSFHHNLLINNTGRNWSMAGGVESDGKTYAGYLDIRYNVVYNWYNRTTDGGARRVNFVGNYYKMGAQSLDMDIFSIDGNELNYPDHQIAYVAENKMVDTEGKILLDPVLDDPWKKAFVRNVNNNLEDPNVAISNEPFFESYVAESTADEAYDSVIADVGAKVPAWDYLDSRYIKEVTEGTYTYTGSKDGLLGIIDSQTDVGGYPNEDTFKGGEAPLDTDHDGMPDEWETLHGLNPEDASDNSVITLSAEGYTNIEMYLNELMNDPLVWKNEDQRPDPTATPKPTDTPEPTEVPYTLGDVNDDGNVNALDALAVLKHAARIEILEGDALLAGDVTKNNTADAQDALKILQLAAGIIDSFE